MSQLLSLAPPLDDSIPATAEQIAPVLDHTQGHILERHRRDHVWNLLLRFRNPNAAGMKLADLPCWIPSVRELRNEAARVRNDLKAGNTPNLRPPVCFVGASARGCTQLGIDLTRFPQAFADGFHKRVYALLRRGDDAWEDYWRGERFDAILVCAGDNPRQLAELHGLLTVHFGQLAEIVTEKGAVLARKDEGAGMRGKAVEHFGFVDGISQPAFFVDQNDRTNRWKSQYQPAAKLNLALVPDPLFPPNSDQFGSYMAYLKIEQHIDAFREAVSNLAPLVRPTSGLTASEYASALIIGRHFDGAPLVGGAGGNNDFDRYQDATGSHWPFAAHTCKMNAREGTDTTRRIVRRGITYEENDKKGLLFQSFQAMLESQFEEQLAAWATNPNHPRDDTGPDPIIGAGGQGQHYPTDNPKPVCVSQLTTIRGGEYFYFPSIQGIKALAGQSQNPGQSWKLNN